MLTFYIKTLNEKTMNYRQYEFPSDNIQSMSNKYTCNFYSMERCNNIIYYLMIRYYTIQSGYQNIINGDLQLYKMNVSRLNDVIYIDMYTNQVMGFIIATFVDTAHTHRCAPYKCI